MSKALNGAAMVGYCKSFLTKDLKGSGLPLRGDNG